MKLHQPAILFLLLIFAALTLPARENKKYSNCVVLAEQSQNKKDKLYFTATHKNWIFNIRKKQLTEMKSKYKSIKSISAEKKGKTPIIIVPKEQWWTDEILDLEGNSILRIPGLKIYKARWMVINAFSYPKKDRIKICD